MTVVVATTEFERLVRHGRAEDLVDALTTEEKIKLLSGGDFIW